MKWVLRSTAFAICAAAGLISVLIASLMESRNVYAVTLAVNAIEELDGKRPTSPGGIRVSYSGFLSGAEDGPQFLKFTVHNDQSWPISYATHTSEDPFPAVHVNGKKLPGLGRCGTGIQTFYILPGSSAEFRVASYEFRRRPGEGDKVQVGFYLREFLHEEATPHLSEPFQPPPEFVDAITEYKHSADED